MPQPAPVTPPSTSSSNLPYSLEKINSILSKLITHLKGVKILWLMH